MDIKENLIEFIFQNKASLFGYLFFSLAIPISNIYLPHLYGKIIEEINTKKTIDRKVKIRFACILILWIIVQLFWAAMNVIDSKFIPKLRSHVRKYIVQKVLKSYKQDYREEELGGIVAELVRLPDEIEHMFGNIRNYILPMTFMLVFSIGYFTWTNPLLGGISIAAVGSYLFTAFQYSKKCIPICGKMHDSHKELHGEINDCLGNLLNIYTANQDFHELDRLDEYENNFSEKHRRVIRCSGNFRLALNLCYIVLFCSINLTSFYLFSKNKIELSKVVSILIITLEMVSKMASFIGSIDRIMQEMSLINKVQQFLDVMGSEKELGCQRPNLDGSIVYKDVKIERDKVVVEHFNLTVDRGETVLFKGEIGCGKTSLINALIRLIPFTGDIFVGGHNTRDVDIGYLRDHILYVPQNPRLFNRSIYENISYGNGADRKLVRDTLDRYGMNIDIDLPAGKFGQWLSGGQRQIIYMLRCLFKNSPFVILDEPTASLDSETKNGIFSVLYDILRKKTVIIISHDPEIVPLVDKIINIK